MFLRIVFLSSWGDSGFLNWPRSMNSDHGFTFSRCCEIHSRATGLRNENDIYKSSKPNLNTARKVQVQLFSLLYSFKRFYSTTFYSFLWCNKLMTGTLNEFWKFRENAVSENLACTPNAKHRPGSSDSTNGDGELKRGSWPPDRPYLTSGVLYTVRRG